LRNANGLGGYAAAPAGHCDLESFHLDGSIPVWVFAAGGFRAEARVWLEQGAKTVYTVWRLLPDAPVSEPVYLWVTLLVNGCDHHGATDRSGFHPVIDRQADDRLTVTQPDNFGRRIQRPPYRSEQYRSSACYHLSTRPAALISWASTVDVSRSNALCRPSP